MEFHAVESPEPTFGSLCLFCVCGDGAMPEYRLYFLNDGDRIIRAQDLDCADDDAAIAAALALDHAAVIEIWNRRRLVSRVRPLAASLS